MFSGIIRYLPALVTAAAIISATTALPAGTAVADPTSQDQKFFDLLGEKDIPPVDNDNSLIVTAHKVCSKLDNGMSVDDMVDLMRNNGFNENPLTRLQPQRRVTATINRFITASVEAYCPYDKGKIASIAGYRTTRSADPVYMATAHTRNASMSRGLLLASIVGTLPAGEIAPTKPLPVPAAPPPEPQEVQPVPQQPPPPPQRRVQPAPQQAPPPQAEPPPEAPPPEAPPPEAEPPAQAAPPAAPAPGRVGGGAGGGDAPASPTPEQPAPPGHVRLAP
jgi:Protein of unknown function (DUF732)